MLTRRPRQGTLRLLGPLTGGALLFFACGEGRDEGDSNSEASGGTASPDDESGGADGGTRDGTGGKEQTGDGGTNMAGESGLEEMGMGGADGDGGSASAGGEAMSASGGTEATGGNASGGMGGSSGVDPDAPITIAKGQARPSGIALSDDYLYWANQGAGSIVRCPLSGCGDSEPELLVDAQTSPSGIFVTDGELYWFDAPDDTTQQLRSCSLNDCAGQINDLLDLNSVRVGDVRVESGFIYYGAWPYFGRCAAPDCAVETREDLGGNPVVSLALDSNYIYVARNGQRTIYRCSLPDCSDPIELVSNVVSTGVAVDDDNLYFSQYNYFEFIDGGDPAIYRCEKNGCTLDEAEVIVDGQVSPFALVVGDTRIFYTNIEQGTVVSVAK